MQVPGATDYDVLIVPTYLYKRFAFFSGADLAVPRAALQKVGFHCYFVETLDDGPVELNAEIIMAAIWARAASGRRLIVVSASKSGAEVALALTRLGSAKTRHVAAWINAVGALQGTPTVDDRLLPDFEFLTGKIDPAGTESMATGRSRQRFNSFKIPRTVFVHRQKIAPEELNTADIQVIPNFAGGKHLIPGFKHERRPTWDLDALWD